MKDNCESFLRRCFEFCRESNKHKETETETETDNETDNAQLWEERKKGGKIQFSI